MVGDGEVDLELQNVLEVERRGGFGGFERGLIGLDQAWDVLLGEMA